MSITTALPLTIGAASAAAGAAKSISSSVFSLFAGSDEKSPPEASQSGLGLDSLLATSGLLDTNQGDLQDQLDRSLDQLEDLLRRTFHQAGQNLPDSFQLRINRNGELETEGNGDFAKQVNGLLQQSEEGGAILSQIAAQAAAIQAATKQQQFAAQYNDDPSAAWTSLQQSKDQLTGIDVTFSDGEATSFQLVSA